jgi:hypothetical protein
MNSLARTIARRYINVGTPLVLMGAMWLYLWSVQWRQYYFDDPRWGHNYLEAAAFLIVGLAYFSRRLLSDAIALIAAILIVPVSLELLPHNATAIAGAAMIVLTIIDMVIERKRDTDILQPSNKRWSFWLKGHLLRFALVMVAHLSLIFFLVRVPAGSYEKDELVTWVFDGAMIVVAILGLLDGAVKRLGSISVPLLGFSAGMATIIASSVILLFKGDAVLWPILAITIVVTAAGIVALIVARRSETGDQAPA